MLRSYDDCIKNGKDEKVCRLLNGVTIGDSSIVIKSIPNESVDEAVEDPPYGINFYSNFRKNKIATTDGIKNDGDNDDLLDEHFGELYRILKPNSHAYVFTRWDTAGKHSDMLKKHGFNVKNHLIFSKNNWSMGDLNGAYANQYEVILFAQKGRKNLKCLPTEDGKLNKHGNPEICRHPDILQFNRVPNGSSMLHNHQKPTDLLEFLIQKSSDEGDIIFDGFLGSGSTAEAANNTNRNWIGIELDPEIAKIATNRLSPKL